MKWFGKAYGGAYEADTPHVETPIGKKCSRCDEVIQAHDDGVIVPVFDGKKSDEEVLHYECWFRTIVGGLNHQLGLCTCCGGALPPDPPELTPRQAAIAAYQYNRYGTVAVPQSPSTVPTLTGTDGTDQEETKTEVPPSGQ